MWSSSASASVIWSRRVAMISSSWPDRGWRDSSRAAARESSWSQASEMSSDSHTAYGWPYSSVRLMLKRGMDQERVRVDRMGDPRRGQAMQNWRRCSSVWPGVRLIRRRTTWVWPEASPGRQSVTSPSRVGKDCPSMVTVSGRAAPRGRVMAAA